MKIKAIIFDFFGVICSDEYWQLFKSQLGIGKFNTLAEQVLKGEVTWRHFVKKVAAETERSPEEVIELYNSGRINLELAACIDELHQKYKTALLTNSHATFINPLLQRTDLVKLFDEVIISSEVGIIKPDPRIYEHTLKLLNVDAAEAIFIDDSPPRVDGAKAIGMRTILYENFEQMKIDLKKLLASSDN